MPLKSKFRGRELLLLIAATLIFFAAIFSMDVPIDAAFFQLLLGFVGVFFLAHVVLSFFAPNSDQVMLPIAALLNGLGIAMIFRLDLALETSMASRQIVWTLVGVVLFVLVLVFLRDHRYLSRFSYILGIVGLILLALPLVWPVSANNSTDARIWIYINGFSVQPGEFSKIFLLLFFSQLLINKRALFNVAGAKILGIEFPRLRDLGPILAVWGIAIFIMAGENDFGPALLLFSTVLGMIYMATGRVSWLMIGTFLVALGGTVIYQISSKIQTRIANFLDPFQDPEGAGFQPTQALFGMSYGGLTGRGLGQGHPYLVPVAWTDYILSSIGEELGLIGVSAILLLFAAFVTRGMITALNTQDSFGKLVAAGLSLTVAIQVFVVTAGISSLMPMTGLTTPFMSQGGSSLMANYILLAIILRISDSTARKVAA
ncbi:FtsW/RodA/SpoVE family cell cycle protein [Corynebacterium sp. HS2168-gen11]|uniref:FtsW/RodA/SpoVE family cell cycle protein n=1 Tax=Corynebacterium sp. HS2168-gen11 TaxID=2974027 RepID=UPI00216B65CA|nr:FtsW/RodA/SpoVE family cell cycle protein [Corynebacterium sp. HS2168-gen11]MCS4535513.1 FtsW/RodA/SpoVE family cell cycle protein [Corynebacterium sp. HS2168-gen11]